MKRALSHNYKTEIGELHVLAPWVVARASSLIRELTIDTEGVGRRFKGALPECCECAMYLVSRTKGRRKLEPRWGSGVFLGTNETSQELIMGAKDGAVGPREHRREGSEEERLNSDEANATNEVTVTTEPARGERRPDAQSARAVAPASVAARSKRKADLSKRNCSRKGGVQEGGAGAGLLRARGHRSR